jgi:beta-aspartyl-peptidase (threonine type)
MPTSVPTVAVHGGAGHTGADDPASAGGPDAPRLVGVRRAAEEALALLTRGGSALDAVELAVRILEDDPTYNAGIGACLTAAGEVELDASIMEGTTLRCGAVAAVADVRNPVTLARRVMEHSAHVLLVGAGASTFAREMGIPAIPNAELVTASQRARWEAATRAQVSPPEHGTVGAVARDVNGRLAAATSTGGTAMKRTGRVGDTPLVGCGTYADDGLAAVSCTGHGERIIQLTLARHAADLVGAGLVPSVAAAEAIRLLGARVGGEGGLILVGPAGAPGFAHNTPVMSRAWSDARGVVRAAL